MWFDGSASETCDRCGFDSSLWTREDASDLLKRAGTWWEQATAGVSDADLNTRPAEGVWSALEYGLHTVMVLPILGWFIEATLAADRAEVVDPYADVDIEDNSQRLVLERRTIVERIEAGAQDLAALVERGSDGWEHVGRTEGDGDRWWKAEVTLLHTIHDTTHHWLDVGEGLARIGAAIPTVTGRVESVRSSGPDRRSDRAMWVSPAPLAAGAGEGVVVSGVEWSALRPATRIRAGDALFELSYPIGGDEPGWYAFVRRPGRIREGEAAVISCID